jgi:hypothetical protein
MPLGPLPKAMLDSLPAELRVVLAELEEGPASPRHGGAHSQLPGRQQQGQEALLQLPPPLVMPPGRGLRDAAWAAKAPLLDPRVPVVPTTREHARARGPREPGEALIRGGQGREMGVE